MSEFRRAFQPGGYYFFTVVSANRKPWLTEAAALSRMRTAFRKVRDRLPFEMDAVVVLPDHLHAVWRLPDGDADFSTRWRLIKHHVSVGREGSDWAWQPRFWEHLLRGESDWRRHVDYVHFNPVKHGLVAAAKDWPHSSFHQAVRRGWYEQDWGRQEPAGLPEVTGE